MTPGVRLRVWLLTTQYINNRYAPMIDISIYYRKWRNIQVIKKAWIHGRYSEKFVTTPNASAMHHKMLLVNTFSGELYAFLCR